MRPAWKEFIILLAPLAAFAWLSVVREDAPAQAQEDEHPVFFSDGFESGTLAAWDNHDSDFDDPDLSVTDDPANVHSGERALQIAAPPGKGAGGKLPKWFMPGYDQIYARWYCKFADSFDQGNHMHFVHLLGNNVNNRWSAFGKAGIKPSGTDFFSTGFEPWRAWGKHPAPGAMMFYAYYPDMQRARDGRYWGNIFDADPPFVVERGRWYCMEVMVKLNEPGKQDGMQVAWVDGQEIIRVENLRWRDGEMLRLNCFWLLLYVHDSTHDGNLCWFDDVVLSHEPIGPLPEEQGDEQ